MATIEIILQEHTIVVIAFIIQKTTKVINIQNTFIKKIMLINTVKMVKGTRNMSDLQQGRNTAIAEKGEVELMMTPDIIKVMVIEITITEEATGTKEISTGTEETRMATEGKGLSIMAKEKFAVPALVVIHSSRAVNDLD